MLLILAFAAGLLRGYSGFGFAMVLALGLLATSPPALAIPVVLLLDLLCSISLWPGARKTFDARVGVRLLVGMLLAVPVGSLALARLPPQWMAPVVAALCLVGGVLVLVRQPLAGRPVATGWAMPAGFISGLVTAMASAGGPPVVVYLLRSGLPAASVRGTAIVFFAVSDVLALASLWWFEVLGLEHLHLAATLLLPALLGNVLGQVLFRRKPMSLHLLIGSVLVLLSAATLAKTLL
ncbi:MAG: sulfite exporter TauE/SafE family protein [Pseudomonas sp.]